MVITITPNIAIDKTYLVDDFKTDKIHRPIQTHTLVGGKGINVARVLKTLGSTTIATGFIGGNIGRTIAELLDEEGIDYDFAPVRGESRMAITIIDSQSGTQTEINENGPDISQEETASLIRKIRSLISGVQYIVMSGSCPPGLPLKFYGDMIDEAKAAGARAILDTSGVYLTNSVRHKPFMIKPNIMELSQFVGRDLQCTEDIVTAAIEVARSGVNIVAVTMGKTGAIATDGTEVWQSTPPPIKLASALGSGDSFVAGFVHAWANREILREALLLGTACGTANASSFGAGFCSKSSIMDVCKGTEVNRIV